jgi:hypothetical protein
MDHADRPPDALRRLKHGRAFISVSISPVSGSSIPSVNVDSTDWLIARLPALAIAMMRSLGLKIWSLRKVETLSRPVVRIRDHDETVPHQNSATIGHSRSPNAPEFFGGQTSSHFRGHPTPIPRGMACAGR